MPGMPADDNLRATIADLESDARFIERRADEGDIWPGGTVEDMRKQAAECRALAARIRASTRPAHEIIHLFIYGRSDEI